MWSDKGAGTKFISNLHKTLHSIIEKPAVAFTEVTLRGIVLWIQRRTVFQTSTPAYLKVLAGKTLVAQFKFVLH
jgi:hypothetical protein